MMSKVRDGIYSAAQALGVSPVDLATAISYETAGTFSPTKRGPRTQWGQHRGLIQFGEPQARRFGVDWKNPVSSQLGPNGAIVKYLRSTGVKRGMGLLDIYSAINAGGVGRYNRSDAKNGGAPGTVMGKVRNQMSGHRAKAARMFAGYKPQNMSAPPIPQPMQSNAFATINNDRRMSVRNDAPQSIGQALNQVGTNIAGGLRARQARISGQPAPQQPQTSTTPPLPMSTRPDLINSNPHAPKPFNPTDLISMGASESAFTPPPIPRPVTSPVSQGQVTTAAAQAPFRQQQRPGWRVHEGDWRIKWGNGKMTGMS